MSSTNQEELFRQVGGFQPDCYGEDEYCATKHDIQQIMNVWNPMLGKWKQVYSDLQLPDL